MFLCDCRIHYPILILSHNSPLPSARPALKSSSEEGTEEHSLLCEVVLHFFVLCSALSICISASLRNTLAAGKKLPDLSKQVIFSCNKQSGSRQFLALVQHLEGVRASSPYFLELSLLVVKQLLTHLRQKEAGVDVSPIYQEGKRFTRRHPGYEPLSYWCLRITSTESQAHQSYKAEASGKQCHQ